MYHASQNKRRAGQGNDALVLVHPECRKEVCEEADFVGSTKQIIDFAEKSEHSKFIIGTEMGVLYKLKRDNPDKTFYLLSQGLICPNMKKTTLESVYNARPKKVEFKAPRFFKINTITKINVIMYVITSVIT